MKQAADVDSDVFRASIYNVLKSMLLAADRDADYRDAVKAIGAELRDDGQWRAQIKNTYALGDSKKRAWDSIASYIAQNGNGAPWWYVLDYADGKAVPKDVTEFFA